MSTDFTVETGKIDDLEDLVFIENACFGADQFSKRQLAYLITTAQGAFFVIRQNGHALAYISLITRTNSKIARIYSIAVHPEFQNRQLGQKLLDKSTLFAHEKKLEQINLEVKVSNEAAVLFYRKNGFQTIGLIPSYYHDGSAAYRMLLQL